MICYYNNNCTLTNTMYYESAGLLTLSETLTNSSTSNRPSITAYNYILEF